ncbi:hypothetical protein Thimo_2913 [Thioflavicoccus mobilis 8321]|uniref:Uncharacterized protein n=1 Tax=Thioflavicoccus mobilis 8321 TaxID=765912 RepID=L0H1Z9_9GAMM|nr:hypothetical protein Thimo_2913 [Thioflavicoccus mobilis 8321]
MPCPAWGLDRGLAGEALFAGAVGVFVRVLAGAAAAAFAGAFFAEVLDVVAFAFVGTFFVVPVSCFVAACLVVVFAGPFGLASLGLALVNFVVLLC